MVVKGDYNIINMMNIQQDSISKILSILPVYGVRFNDNCVSLRINSNVCYSLQLIFVISYAEFAQTFLASGVVRLMFYHV